MVFGCRSPCHSVGSDISADGEEEECRSTLVIPETSEVIEIDGSGRRSQIQESNLRS